MKLTALLAFKWILELQHCKTGILGNLSKVTHAKNCYAYSNRKGLVTIVVNRGTWAARSYFLSIGQFRLNYQGLAIDCLSLSSRPKAHKPDYRSQVFLGLPASRTAEVKFASQYSLSRSSIYVHF